jgi:hypothetical protein
VLEASRVVPPHVAAHARRTAGRSPTRRFIGSW